MLDQFAYLTRIGYEGSVDPSAETLACRTEGILDCAVREFGYPVRTVDISGSIGPFSKDRPAQAGRLCVELNGSVALLLEQLGLSS